MTASKAWRIENKESINQKRRLARAAKKKLLAQQEKDVKLSTLSKVSSDGKRICLYDECGTVLSRYNEDPCCARHQKDWFLENKETFKEIVFHV